MKQISQNGNCEINPIWCWPTTNPVMLEHAFAELKKVRTYWFAFMFIFLAGLMSTNQATASGKDDCWDNNKVYCSKPGHKHPKKDRCDEYVPVCSHQKWVKLEYRDENGKGGWWKHNGQGKFNHQQSSYEATDAEIAQGKEIEFTYTSNDRKGGRNCNKYQYKFKIKCRKPQENCGHNDYCKAPIKVYCSKPGHKHPNKDRCDEYEPVCSHQKWVKLECKNENGKGGWWSHNGQGKFNHQQSSYEATDAEIAQGKEIEFTYTSYDRNGGKRDYKNCDKYQHKFKIKCRKPQENCGHNDACKWLKITGDVHDVTTYGGKDGSIDVHTEGGRAPYTFTWSDGYKHQYPDRKYLPAGNYTVTVKDMKGCTFTKTFYINQPNGHKTAARLDVSEAAAAAYSPPSKELTVYPNVMSNEATIAFSLDQASDYTLDLYDQAGRLVKQISVGKAKAGVVHSFRLDGSQLKPGTYYGKLITPQYNRTLRIMKK